jgi:predicted ATPase
MVEMTSTFVGRQRELEALRNSMQNALKGKGSVVLVAGEAGIGKSELVNELRRDIASITDEEIRIAQAACRSLVGDTDPFRPFHDLFDGVFIDKDKKLRQKLVDIILDIAPDIANLVPVVGGPISAGISISRKLTQTLGIGHDKEHLLERKEISQERFCSEYTKALRGASSVYPLVLIIDDLQWIDDSSVNLLFSLPEKIKDDRILILGAYRPEELAPRAGQPHPLKEILSVMVSYENVSTIELGFLQLEDVSTYISRIYPNNSFPQDFIDFVWKRTEGNSSFVVELIKLLEGDQTIAQEEGTKCSLTKGIQDIRARTPKTVQAVIEHRISNIRDKIDRQIHECASVEGEKFTSDVLSELLSMDKIDLSRKLRIVGEMYNLVRESIETSVEIGSYEFIHSLIHESFYNHLGREERILLHQKIGEILEAKYKGDNRVKEFASTLASHFEEGRIPDKALKYYRIAADEAGKTNSFAEASRLYEKADQIMVKNRIGTAKGRVDILIEMGAIYQILGRGEEARDTLKESLNLNAKIDDDLIKASNLTNIGITSFYLGEFAESINVLEEAQKIYEHHKEDLSKETLETYGICLDWLGVNCRNYWDLEEGKELHQKALKIGEEVNSPRLEAHAIANLGAISLWQKDFSQVIDYWKRSLEISKNANDPPWVAHYTIDVGYMCFLERNYDKAIGYLKEGTEIARESYFEENFARGLMNQGNVWFVKGDFERAMKCYEEALQTAKMRKIAKLIWRLQHNIGNIYRKQGEYENAYEWYLSSIKSLEDMISAFKSEDEKKGFLTHRLDPFRSMIILTWERQEEESQKFAKTFGHDLLIDFLGWRKQGVNLNKEEAENWNFFDGYYVVTE